MCLDKITSTSPTPSGVGYKVFLKRGRQFYQVYHGPRESLPRLTKKWLNEKDFGYGYKLISEYISYRAGWHIFTTLKDAIIWRPDLRRTVRKVKYRNAHTLGRQTNLDVIVAKEIYIIPGEVR